MTITQNREPLTPNRLAAAALAALGAASAMPIPLAQLDFAGLFNAFNIDSGGSPQALLGSQRDLFAQVGRRGQRCIHALARRKPRPCQPRHCNRRRVNRWTHCFAHIG